MSKEHIILEVVTTYLAFTSTALSYLTLRLRERARQHKFQSYLSVGKGLPNWTWNKEAFLDLRKKLDNAQKIRQEILKNRN